MDGLFIRMGSFAMEAAAYHVSRRPRNGVSAGLFQQLDQPFLVEFFPVAVTVDQLAAPVEDEVRRHVDQRREIVVDPRGLANHPYIGMELADHPLQAGFRRVAVTALGPADGNDAELAFPALVQ